MNLEKLFHLKENHTDVRTEVMAGITTFMTMAYILAVNPSILSASGMDSGAVFTATAPCVRNRNPAHGSTFQLSVRTGTRHGTECLFCLHGSSLHGLHLGDGTGSCIRGRYHLPGPVSDQCA